LITFCDGKGTPMFFIVSEKNIDYQIGDSLITENGPVISAKFTVIIIVQDSIALVVSF
jgi:hypothetical protein